MIVTGARGSRVPTTTSGYTWKVVTTRVCIYWVDVLADLHTNVYMTSQRETTCDMLSCTPQKSKRTMGFMPVHGTKFVCYHKVTCEMVEPFSCRASRCSCPMQLKAQVKTVRFINDMQIKFDPITGEPTDMESSGDKKVEEMIDYKFGDEKPRDWQLYRWENCVGEDCPGTQGVTE